MSYIVIAVIDVINFGKIDLVERVEMVIRFHIKEFVKF